MLKSFPYIPDFLEFTHEMIYVYNIISGLHVLVHALNHTGLHKVLHSLSSCPEVQIRTLNNLRQRMSRMGMQQ